MKSKNKAHITRNKETRKNRARSKRSQLRNLQKAIAYKNEEIAQLLRRLTDIAQFTKDITIELTVANREIIKLKDRTLIQRILNK